MPRLLLNYYFVFIIAAYVWGGENEYHNIMIILQYKLSNFITMSYYYTTTEQH